MHETNHTQRFQETAEDQEARFEGLKKRLNSSSKYLQSNDMRVTELRQGYARVEMTIDEHILNIHGFVHGGALFSLADTAAGSASFTTGREIGRASCRERV